MKLGSLLVAFGAAAATRSEPLTPQSASAAADIAVLAGPGLNVPGVTCGSRVTYSEGGVEHEKTYVGPLPQGCVAANATVVVNVHPGSAFDMTSGNLGYRYGADFFVDCSPGNPDCTDPRWVRSQDVTVPLVGCNQPGNGKADECPPTPAPTRPASPTIVLPPAPQNEGDPKTDGSIGPAGALGLALAGATAAVGLAAATSECLSRNRQVPAQQQNNPPPV